MHEIVIGYGYRIPRVMWNKMVEQVVTITGEAGNKELIDTMASSRHEHIEDCVFVMTQDTMEEFVFVYHADTSELFDETCFLMHNVPSGTFSIRLGRPHCDLVASSKFFDQATDVRLELLRGLSEPLQHLIATLNPAEYYNKWIFSVKRV